MRARGIIRPTRDNSPHQAPSASPRLPHPLLPPARQPYYAYIAGVARDAGGGDTASTGLTNVGFAASLAGVTALALSALFNARYSLEDPFLPDALDGIHVAREFDEIARSAATTAAGGPLFSDRRRARAPRQAASCLSSVVVRTAFDGCEWGPPPRGDEPCPPQQSPSVAALRYSLPSQGGGRDAPPPPGYTEDASADSPQAASSGQAAAQSAQSAAYYAGLRAELRDGAVAEAEGSGAGGGERSAASPPRDGGGVFRPESYSVLNYYI